MREKEPKALKDLKQIALDLRTFLRKRPALAESEQLAIENCLLMLQIEYARWRKETLEKPRRDRATNEDTHSPPC
ncbi:hypothetical protein [Nitrospira moscoviensis]|uniref:Uncharacterized protein n=1 Tax=Nitrospira moscoviensis TaxID=42253 RepID=A0A0K2GEA4_NITMO|nr:hypothetical protein [Nitrospira moscoviensis]ALA58912.1 hypothetical protein NITMOv2_2499 [Nitrospira moscoviensis]